MAATYRPAGMSSFDRMNIPTECGCCGRSGLKTTVKMVAPDGATVWMGTGCAAKACGQTVIEFKKDAKEADYAIASEARRAAQAENTRWFAFLDAAVPALKGEVISQWKSFGSMAAAREAYAAYTG